MIPATATSTPALPTQEQHSLNPFRVLLLIISLELRVILQNTWRRVGNILHKTVMLQIFLQGLVVVGRHM